GPSSPGLRAPQAAGRALPPAPGAGEPRVGARIRATAQAQRVGPALSDDACRRRAAEAGAGWRGRGSAFSAGDPGDERGRLMASLNKVLLIGNLTRAPELRYTPSGTAVSELRLAVNRNYSTQSGEKREETCFLTVVVWGKQAESCGEYLDKGSQVFVEGRLQTRDWEGKDGQKRTSTEGVAERVQFMSRTKGAGAGAPAAMAAAPAFAEEGSGGGEDDVPF